MNKKKILIQTINSPKYYSGGRYHAWMMVQALALIGHDVSVWTNNIPVFINDFKNFPKHENIDLIIDKNFKKYPDGKFDIIIVIPHQNDGYNFYKKALLIAKRSHSKLILLNFESPNWFNKYSLQRRDVKLWDGWFLVSKYADMILSSAKESTKFAKEYYIYAQTHTIFTDCYPAINTIVADEINIVKKEKQIICLTRFTKDGLHKGGMELIKAICPTMSGYTLALIIGTGLIEGDYYRLLKKKANKFDIKIKLLSRLSDKEKFTEIKKSQLMLFLSYFEGFGYPPVEAQYCDVPCIVYDLPVLREVSNDGIIYVKPGNINELQKRISEVLTGKYKVPFVLSEHIKEIASFDKYTKNLHQLVNELGDFKEYGINKLSMLKSIVWVIIIKLDNIKNKIKIKNKIINIFIIRTLLKIFIKNIIWIILRPLYFNICKVKRINQKEQKSNFKIITITRNINELYKETAKVIYNCIIKKDAPFYLVLSGGEMSKGILKELAENYNNLIDWSKIYFFWTDERCVEPNDNDSNYKLAKDYLLDCINCNNIFRMKGEIAPEKASIEYEKIIKLQLKLKEGELPKFDLMLLDVGLDGDTASLFPDTKGLNKEGRFVIANYVPKLNSYRLSLTFSVINNIGTRIFIVSGKAKSKVFHRATQSNKREKVIPLDYINRQNSQTKWVVDKEAYFGK